VASTIRVKLNTGYATVHSHRWPTVPQVWVDRRHVVYGDLNGDGRDESALLIVCANLGGTAASSRSRSSSTRRAFAWQFKEGTFRPASTHVQRRPNK